MEEARRPDPEQLLARIRAEEDREQKKERGKLKIFLGFAAGTGKTYAMLEAAQALKRHGVDVAAGYVEPHARPETMAMLRGLEQLPPLTVEYRGMKLREFDLDGALKRRPRVLLVDELAHTNAPGCRHQKRYQDIEELLAHGINVYTTLNVQHLESLNDIVEGITGIEVKERIPDRIFDDADQVKLVDIEAGELIERMQEGRIYSKTQAQRALQNFFTRDKLTALREIALRRMADRVNYLAEKEKKEMGTGEFSAGEHVLTCISPSPTNAKVIRTAARLAYAFHAEFTALYVETRGLQNMDEKARKRRDENMRLARTLGARIVSVYGEDIAWQIAEYAKIGNVTKLVMGRTNHRLFLGQKRGTMVDCINQYAPNLDIYIIPDLKNGRRRGRYKPDAAAKYADGPTGRNFLRMALVLAACAGIALGLTEAEFALKACGYGYPVTFALMFAVSLLSSCMMTKIQRQNEENAKRAYRTEILLTNSRKLRRAYTREAVSSELASQIQKLMNFTVIVYLKRDNNIQEPRVYLRRGLEETAREAKKLDYTSGQERAVADWVFGNGRRAGCTTHTLPEAGAIYLPVMDGENVMAVVGMVLEERREIGAFEYDIITAMLDEAALVLERIQRIDELGRAQWVQEGMED